MADVFRVASRSHEPWCGHDNNTVAGCQPCWKQVKRTQRRKARRVLRLDSRKHTETNS